MKLIKLAVKIKELLFRPTDFKVNIFEGEEDLIRAIFECWRNTALCALVLGVSLWLKENSSATFRIKILTEVLDYVGIILLGLNLLYLNIKLTKLRVPRIVWFLTMLLLGFLSFLSALILAGKK